MVGRAWSLSQRILYDLPATVGEVAAIERVSARLANAVLYQLRCYGLVRLSERKGARQHRLGRTPRLWERVR